MLRPGAEVLTLEVGVLALPIDAFVCLNPEKGFTGLALQKG